MNRRSFLASILALAAAPAIVRADSLMRIVARAPIILAARRLLGHASVTMTEKYVRMGEKVAPLK